MIRMGARLVAALIACSLVAAPRVVTAQPASAPAEEPPVEEPPELVAAKKAYFEGRAMYDTADYQGAIKAWTRAVELLPDTPENREYLLSILFNIASAHEKLFDLDGDVIHLKQAKVLLERFEASISEIYDEESQQAERAQVKERLAKLDERIAEATAPPPPENEPKTEPTQKPGPDQPPKRESKPGRGLVIGGGVAIGLGVGAFAGMGAALGVANNANDISDLDDSDVEARGEQFDRGRAADKGAVAAAVIGGLLMGAGIALLVVGLKRRNARTAIAPAMGPRTVGLSIVGRF